MDWSDLGKKIADFAPLLGTAVAGPGGAAIGSIIASAFGTSNDPASINAAIVANPDAAVKLQQIQADNKTQLAQIAANLTMAEITGSVQNAGDINKTMQAEAASEHWPTWSWRPAIGLSVAIAVLLSVLTVFLAYGAAILYGHAEGLAQLPGILAAVAGIIGVVSPILGIASYFRGRMQADPSIPTNNKG